MKNVEKLGEPKFSYNSGKDTKGLANAGSTCFIFLDFFVLMRDEKRNFVNWILPKTLVVSLLKLVRRAKIFEILECFQSHNISPTKK